MPTHNDPRLLWVRYSPQTMLLDTATMTLHAEVAHRRLSDFALSAKPWLAPESAAFLSVTRLTPENLASALVELKSAGWRIRNHMLWHSHLNAEITSSQAMRHAGYNKAVAAALSRWHRPAGTTDCAHANGTDKRRKFAATLLHIRCTDACVAMHRNTIGIGGSI